VRSIEVVPAGFRAHRIRIIGRPRIVFLQSIPRLPQNLLRCLEHIRRLRVQIGGLSLRRSLGLLWRLDGLFRLQLASLGPGCTGALTKMMGGGAYSIRILISGSQHDHCRRHCQGRQEKAPHMVSSENTVA
jgi:hypothetical protein